MIECSNTLELTSSLADIRPLLDEIYTLKSSENYDKAIDKLKKILPDYTSNSDLHVLLGDLYYEKHKNIYESCYTIDDAITQYQFALEMKSNCPEAHYKIGKAFYIKGEFEKALAHFRNCLKFAPSHAKANYMLGIIETKRDNFDEALLFFEKAIKISPWSFAKAHYNIFCLLNIKIQKNTAKNKFTYKLKALKHILLSFLTLPFDKNARLDIKNSIILINSILPTMLKCYYYERIGIYNKAIENYNVAIEKAVGFAPLYISLGDAYKKLNRLEDAVNEYRMAVWLNPSNIQAYKSLCNTFEEMGDFDNAIKTYKKLLSFRQNDAILYSNMANILYMKGDVSNAISAYQTAIVLNPNKTWTSVVAQTLGYVFQQSKGDYDAAIAAYQTANLLNPDDVDIYISLGSAFFDKGDINNALAAYKSALEIDCKNAKVHCNMGYLLWGKNALQESLSAYETAIKLDPYYDIAYNNLGVIYLDDLGNIEKAMNLFNKAIDINPNYALAYYNMGRAMCVVGKKIDAARFFQIAMDLNAFTNELDTNEIKERISRLFESD